MSSRAIHNRNYIHATLIDFAGIMIAMSSSTMKSLQCKIVWFGRRVRPGQYFALSGVYMVMATILATMKLDCPVGPDGREMKPEVTFSNGLSAVPNNFGCVFTPRSIRAKELLEAA